MGLLNRALRSRLGRALEAQIDDAGVRRYAFSLDGADYKVRMVPRRDDALVEFARRGPQGEAAQYVMGDRSPAAALRLMRTIAGIVEDDAENFASPAYSWAGMTRGHDDLYAALLRRYGAPEGYDMASSAPQLRRKP